MLFTATDIMTRVLIVEDQRSLLTNLERGLHEEGYEVIPASTIREAREIAASDMRRRTHRLGQGSDPMCPARYLVWAQGDGGEYATVDEIEPS